MSNNVIVCGQIKSTLKELNRLYLNPGKLDSALYCKLALIEYCGWLECTIDLLILKALSRIRKDPLPEIGMDHLNKTYGFSYKNHFLSIFIKTIGLKNTESLINHLDSNGSLQLLESRLNNLKKDRNDAAHTYSNSTKTFNAPSIYLTYLDEIFPIFKEIYKYLIHNKV